MTCAAATVEGLATALRQDPRVVVFGSADFAGVTASDEVHRLYAGLHLQFQERYVAGPRGEFVVCGMAAGAALAGLRPIVSIPTGGFALEALPSILNDVALARYMSAGRTQMPVTYHMNSGVRGAGGAQHSHSMLVHFAHTPGLHVLVPAVAQDFRDLIGYSLLHSQDPVVFINHARLFDVVGSVQPAPFPVAPPRATIRRRGRDVTVVAVGVMVGRALAAARRLSREGISIEVLDPRALVPLDLDTILDSVRRTGRLVVADESNLRCGAAGDIVAQVTGLAFGLLRAGPQRVGIRDVPIPFSHSLESAVTPGSQAIVDAVRQTMT